MRDSLRGWALDVGLVLVGFGLLLGFENIAIGIGYQSEFASTWEMAIARSCLTPLALAASIPFAALIVAVARRPRLAPGIAALVGLWVSVGVSSGRHLQSLALRLSFMVLVTAAAGGLGYLAARRLPARRPGSLALLGLGVAILSWLADAFVLPRLYPAFHLALFGLVLLGSAAFALPLRATRLGRVLSVVALLAAALSVIRVPSAAARVASQDNLRRVLIEHAPVLGPAVLVAAQIKSPPPLDDDGAATTTLTSLRDRNGAHALDWRGHDIVLVTIDALRADHLGAYGYARKTSPFIDSIAQHGIRFDHAYCPTPHTSYSIASMMTGKYMKSLLALRGDEPNDDLAADMRDTWPVEIQRYGYRTAAFYPPAVFFIDEHRFREMRDSKLGFEYAKVEFAKPELRKEQIASYLATVPRDKPLFLWVHIFEPHEPYEMHPEHPFSGDPRVDAYDSEIAEADAMVGAVQEIVAKSRPAGPIMIVSADHGEEHGDHGGRYHGTTVYEEQVRVPLIVSVPGIAPHVVETPVQTIDLLPTTLAALDVPIPPRLRGRDLGTAIAGVAPLGEQGLAFAETDDYTLVARGPDRLVCQRKVASCTLFDVAKDPGEKHPIADRPDRVAELRKLTAAIEKETGRVEASGLPEALRRGMQGDLDAAEDVAPLLDDSRVDIRRLAARCGFRLKAPAMSSALARALGKDEDAEVRTWSALALARLGETAGKPLAEAAFSSGSPEQKLAAALAFGEHGDARGEGELVARWNSAFDPEAKKPGEVDEGRALLAVFGALKTKAAVPGLVRSLEDLRLRPYIVETLGDIGDPRAKDPLLALFTNERYVHLRPTEARALLKLGARTELVAPLTRFAGVPEPMPEAMDIMIEGKLLPPKPHLAAAGPARLLIASRKEPTSGRIGGATFGAASKVKEGLWVVEVGDQPAGDIQAGVGLPGPTAEEQIAAMLEARRDGGAAAEKSEEPARLWLVPRAEEIPPPAPKAWDAGSL